MDERVFLDVPREVLDIISEATAYSITAKLYVKMPFGFKKAVKCNIKSVKMKEEFWKRIQMLYPEIYKNFILHYSAGNVYYFKNEVRNG